jgi:plasmid stability protein
MGHLLLRHVDDDLIRRLKDRAAARGLSAEAEHRLILEQAFYWNEESFAERAAKWRRLTAGRETTNSARTHPRRSRPRPKSMKSVDVGVQPDKSGSTILEREQPLEVVHQPPLLSHASI